MKRFAAIFVVLVSLLSGGLYLGLRKQQLELERPSGGSATLEGVEVGVVARLATRVVSVNAVEGQRVEAGQALVSLDCTEMEAARAEATAAVRAAEVSVGLAEDGVELARVGVGAAKNQTRAARSRAQAGWNQMATLRVQREAARRELERVERLLASGSGTEQLLDKARSTVEALDRQMAAAGSEVAAVRAQSDVVATSEAGSDLQVQMAQGQVEAARQNLERARAALRRTEALVAECTLSAPISGVVQTRAYEPGEVVLPGTRVLSIVNIDKVHATFYLPNAELAAARPGGAVEVVADAYPGEVFEGVVQRVGVEAEFTPRNVQTRDDRDRLVYAVEVSVDNPDGRLRAGMSVEVTLPGTGKE